MRKVGATGVGLLIAAILAVEVMVSEVSVNPEPGQLDWLFAGGTVYDLCAGVIAYLAPLWVALARGHPDSAVIAAVSLLLGWTVVGWLAAMVWAFSRVSGGTDALHGPGLDWSDQHRWGRSGH